MIRDRHQSQTAQAPAPERELAGAGTATPPISEHAGPDASRPRAADPHRKGITPQQWHLLVDVLMLSLAIAAVVLTAPLADDPVENPVWLVALPLIVLVLLALRGMYGPRIGPRFLDDAGYIVAATAVAVMAVTFARILFTGENVPGSQGLREWFFVAAFLTAGHAAVTVTETRSRRKHGGGRPTLIIGAGRVGHLLAKRLLAKPELGLRPVGFLDGAETGVEETSQSSGISRASSRLSSSTKWSMRSSVSLASRPRSSSTRCSGSSSSVCRFPSCLGCSRDYPTASSSSGRGPAIGQHLPVDLAGLADGGQYGFDRAFAALALLLLSPLLIAAAVGVLASVGRPLFSASAGSGSTPGNSPCSSSGP